MRVVGALLALALLTGCVADPQSAPEPDAKPAAPTDASSAAPQGEQPGAPAPSTGSAARAVYWLGATEDRRGPRLYREFVQRPAGADAVRDAVELMLAGSPEDPDYTSLWAKGTSVRDVGREDGTAVVDLSREAKTSGGGSAFEAMTLQQLVHTVTAADPALTSVRLLVEGERVETLWGSADTSQPLTRSPSFEVLGPVWISVPQGGTVSGDFGGTATVFEATVSWELRQGDRVVQEGFSTASKGAPDRGEWTGRAAVPPGDYELWAYESSAEDGSVTWLDTKRVTVR